MNVPSDTSNKRRQRSRRALLGIVAGGLAALTGLGAANAGPAARRRARKRLRRRPRRRPIRRFKVVTRVYTNATPIEIRDGAPARPYPSAITVSGLPQGQLLDVNVRLNRFSHTSPQDVDLMLEAPNGLSALLMSDVGGDTDAEDLTIVIDDEAGSPFTGDPLTSGSYQPANRQIVNGNNDADDAFPPPAAASRNIQLSTFAGINPNGTWKLYLVDDSSGDDGVIAGGWSLIITARARV